MTNKSIKAVLWDFGGVLTTSPFESFNRYEKEQGLPDNFLRTVNSTNPHENAWAKFERSQVTAEEFDELFLKESTALGHPVRGQAVIQLLAGDIRTRVVSALTEISKDMKCVCLTNNVSAGKGPGMSRSEEAQKAVLEVMQLFDQVIESSKIGMRKPDPEIYKYTCEQMGMQPDEILYLDDLGVNLKPAAQMGMQTIKVLGEDQLLDDLGTALGRKFN
ncbi:HAD-IA family hydrolase [Sneathiella sp. P13V-1]|uniref:HAD-IA family hydrolase n=1 Tax=Sneathiella sp. P13V-1 TaxID=2697366 RepID=UPI00187B468B|nr:HAD-IA family hydrolase [Sneathiella sp. P13V-1]MBE7638531.1 HAD-IA family hydrolase [Sneathiella sp. P13V-1]